MSFWHLYCYRWRHLLRQHLSLAVLMVTGCPHSSAAVSCLGKDILGGNLLSCLHLCWYRWQRLLRRCLILTAAFCHGGLDDNLWSRFQQQRLLVSATMSSVAPLLSCGHLCWYRWQRLLQKRHVSTATFLSVVLVVTQCLPAASCLVDNVFDGAPIVSLVSVLVPAVVSSAAASCIGGLGGDLVPLFFGSIFLSWQGCPRW